MTKGRRFAAGAGGEHIADLDLIVADDDAVDEQLHQLPALGKCQTLQRRLHTPAEVVDARGQGRHLVLLVHLGLDLAPLVRQAVEQAEDLLAFAGELLAPDDLGQIGLQHALLLAFELRERGAEVLVPGP